MREVMKDEHWRRLCRGIENTMAWKTIKKIKNGKNSRGTIQTIPPKQLIEEYSNVLK